MKNSIYLFLIVILSLSIQAQNDLMPKSGPTPSVNIGKPQYFELKNGLKVMVVENHKLARVSYNLSIDNSPYLEGNKKGVSNLTGQLLGTGSQKITKTAFNEEIDFLGATIQFSETGAYAAGLSKYGKRILELMTEGVLHTVFTQTEFDAEKEKLLESLKATEKSVSAVSRRLENVLTYGKSHPFGEFMTENTINAVNFNDVIENYNTYFVPENAYLIVIGDVKFDEIKANIEQLFESWQKGTAPNPSYSNPKDLQYSQINFVDMPNAVQSEIAIINLCNLKMSDPDYFASILANHILGGDYSSYLMSNIREKNAWTYDAGSSIRGSKYVSRFIAYSEVRNSVTDSTIVEMFKEIKRIRTEKVADAELKNVIASYIGQFVMQIEKPQTIASYALNIKTQGLAGDFYENYIKNINAVSAEDILRVANKYFLPEVARIVVVGKGADVLPGLEKLKVPIFYFDKNGNPTEKPNYKIAIPAGVTVKTVLDSYINAIGGEKALKNVKTLYTISSGTIQGAPVELTSKVTTGNKQIREMKVMGMSMMKQVVNDKGAYIIQQGNKKVVEKEEFSEMKASANPFNEMNLLNKKEVKLDGIDIFNEKECYVIKADKSTLYYDVKTGLKIAESKTMEVEGQQLSQSTTFSDYRNVKGIQIPFVTNINIGMEILLTITDVKINEGVYDADFE